MNETIAPSATSEPLVPRALGREQPGPSQPQGTAGAGAPNSTGASKAHSTSHAEPRVAIRKAHLFAGTAVLLAVTATLMYLPRHYALSTDDAFVQSDSVAVVAKVGGYVTALSVDDNSRFDKDQLLAQIDSRDYDVAVQNAQADVESAKAAQAVADKQVLEQSDLIAEARAALSGDRANVEFAGHQVQRYQQLVSSGAGSVERAQQSQSEQAQRQAELQRDVAKLAATESHVAVLASQSSQAHATVAKAQATLAKAQLDLSYTRIRAVFPGTVANKTAVVGSYVQPGQQLFTAVPEKQYVVANFKETEVARIHPGQAVRILSDAVPGRSFTGHVDSIQRGTGSNFALLPPENATGNFVKIVQRVPVKIVFDESSSNLHLLTAGMSVEPHVVLGEPPAWLAAWVLR